jgi:hypothetical protein
MDIDSPEEGQGQHNEDAGSQLKPKKPIEALRVNRMTPNREEMDEPEESQTIVSKHPREGAVEDVTGRPEKYVEE